MVVRFFGWLPVVGLASCMVGPDFKKPEVELPQSFSQDGMTWKRQVPEALPKSGAWWKVYRDRELTRLVEQALAQNQAVEATAERLEQARATSKATRSLFFPNIQLDLGARRTKSIFRGPSGGSIYYNSYTVPLEFSYEVDVWGKVRRQLEGSKAGEAAAEETLRALRLTVAGEVVQTYWALRAVDADRDVLKRTLDVRRKALSLLEKQHEAGAISALDLSRARTEVATAEADRIRLDQQRVELVTSLAVLTGRIATGFDVAQNAHLPSPPSIPASLPSEMLQQRPDVRAALYQVAAANAGIGVATAAMYPSFTLTSSGGYDAQRVGDLFRPDTLVWALGGNLVAPISSQKLLRHRREATLAAHRAVAADYRQTVIESIAEVENALQAVAILQRREKAQQEALEAAKDTYNHSLKRFEVGMASLLDVVDAERVFLAAQRNTNALCAESLAISASLIKALGGKW